MVHAGDAVLCRPNAAAMAAGRCAGVKPWDMLKRNPHPEPANGDSPANDDEAEAGAMMV